MHPRSGLILALLSLVAAAALVLSAPAGAAPKVVNGSVGPGFTISLKSGGKKVTSLKAGTYRFDVSDRSPIHDFHITGPSFDRTFSSIRAQGTTTVVLKLKKGSYLYYCDLHRFPMTGTFEVV